MNEIESDRSCLGAFAQKASVVVVGDQTDTLLIVRGARGRLPYIRLVVDIQCIL